MDDADLSEAVDLGAVIGSPDIKIMSVAGNGAEETMTDLLFARCIDVGIVQTDELESPKQKPPFPDLEKFLQYITKLYDQEIHILARNDIHSLNDLRDERVSFGTYESGTYMSANAFFKRSASRCKARCLRSLLLSRNFGAEKSLRWSIPPGNQPASFKPSDPRSRYIFCRSPALTRSVNPISKPS